MYNFFMYVQQVRKLELTRVRHTIAKILYYRSATALSKFFFILFSRSCFKANFAWNNYLEGSRVLIQGFNYYRLYRP